VTTGPVALRHNREMLRVALWIVRMTGLLVVGLLTFLALPSTRGGAVTQAVAYAVICGGVAAWGVAEFSPALSVAARRTVLTVAFGAMATAGCLGAAAGGGGVFLVAYSAIALMSAAEELSVQAVLICALTGVLAAEIGGVLFGVGVGTMAGFPLLLAVGVLMGRNRAALRVQAEQARQLLAQHEQLRAEQRRADVLEERTRIAREIHDVLAHSLGALGIQLQTVKALFTVHNDPERALEALAGAQRMATDGLTETRRAVHALRNDAVPLQDELVRATAEVAERHHVPVGFRTSGTPVPLPPEATVALLRIAQESLVNAIKHAPGSEIAVNLGYRDDSVRLTLANPLPRESTAAVAASALRTLDSGYGLTGMRERLLLLRGSLEAGPRDGQWVVTAELPLPASPLPASPHAGVPAAAKASPAPQETDR
jgi:signal transduction histidine kinase